MEISTIMISGIGTSTSQNFVKALADSGIKTIGLDFDPINAGRFIVDEFDTVPAAQDPAFIPVLEKLIDKYSPDLYVPIIDYEFPILGRNPLSIKTTLPSLETILLCGDKGASIDAFVSAGVLSPPRIAANDPIWPKMVRPQFEGRASLGAMKVNTLNEWTLAAGKLSCPITTVYKRGTEITVDVLCDTDSNVIAYASRERVDVKSGVAYKSRLYHDTMLDQQVQNICKRFRLRYLNCMQAIRIDTTNTLDDRSFDRQQYWWFEVNPRFGGGSVATTMAGLNLPKLLIKMLDYRVIEPKELIYRDGVSVRALKEYFIP